MAPYEVRVNGMQGADQLLRHVFVPVLAKSRFRALNQAERFVNMSTAKNQWGEAVHVWEIPFFPPFPPAPTAIAA